MSRDYAKLKELLDQQETFPTEYLVKFIGKNSPRFQQAVIEFESRYVGELRQQLRRESSGGRHLALTYMLQATSSDHIIEVLIDVHAMEDIVIIL